MQIKLYTGVVEPSDGDPREVLVLVFEETNTMQLFDQDSIHEAWASYCKKEAIDDVDEMAETLLDMLMWAIRKGGMDEFDPSKFPPAKLTVFKNLDLMIEADLQKAPDETEEPKVLH